MSKIDYKLLIYDVVNKQQLFLSINNFNNDQPFYLQDFTLVNSVLNPLENTLKFSLDVNSSYETTTSPRNNAYLKPGNIVILYEYLTGSNSEPNVLFKGYLPGREFSKYIGSVATLDFQCISLLGQLDKQSLMVRTEDIYQLGKSTKTGKQLTITELYANKVELNTLVNTIFNNTLFTSGIIKTTPIQISDISPTAGVWFFAENTSTKYNALETTLYAYQKAFYQEMDGTIKISNLNYNNNSAAQDFFLPEMDEYIPEQYTQINGWGEIDRSADMPNMAYATLISMPFNTNNGSQYSTEVNVSDNKIFPRMAELYQTGYFDNIITKNVDLGDNMITDPVLFSIIEDYNKQKFSQKILNVKYLNNTSSSTNLAGLYALRELSKRLAECIVTTIKYPRLADIYFDESLLNELPFGKMVGVKYSNNQKENLFCNKITITAARGEVSTVNIELIKPFTGIALWN